MLVNIRLDPLPRTLRGLLFGVSVTISFQSLDSCRVLIRVRGLTPICGLTTSGSVVHLERVLQKMEIAIAKTGRR